MEAQNDQVKSKFERIQPIAEVIAASVISLLVAVSYGWNYCVNNQVVYMLSSLRVLHPDILGNDWFATGTTHYHAAFKYLAAALIALSPNGFAVGVVQTLAIAAGMMGAYFLIRTLVEQKLAAISAFLLLALYVTITRTLGPNDTYIFTSYLQPSTLGSAAFLISVPLFMRERWLASGIALAVSGMFHANYLLLFFGGYSIAHVMLGLGDFRRNFRERILPHLGPAVIVLALFAPMILATAGAKEAREAQEIYVHIRAPHHFIISGHERDYIPLVAWTLIALGAAVPLARNGKSPLARLSVLVCALSGLVWFVIVLSVVGGSRPATQLFAWRIVPHIEMLLTALGCAVFMRVLVEPGLGRRYNGVSLGLVTVGLAALCLAASFLKWAMLPLVVLLVVLALVLSQAVYRLGGHYAQEALRTRMHSLWSTRGPVVLCVLSLLATMPWVGADAARFRARSNVFHGLAGDDHELFAWMRDKTPKEAIFLTPPNNENMRFYGQRAIVVDWKSNPIVPGEVLEWKRRLDDVVGRPLQNGNDLAGYDTLDEARIEKLREKYHIEYAVVRRGREKNLGKYKAVYSNRSFVVLDVRG